MPTYKQLQGPPGEEFARTYRVAVVSQFNVELFGYQVIDGHMLQPGEVVLCVGQDDTGQNGPWIVREDVWQKVTEVTGYRPWYGAMAAETTWVEVRLQE